MRHSAQQVRANHTRPVKSNATRHHGALRPHRAALLPFPRPRGLRPPRKGAARGPPCLSGPDGHRQVVPVRGVCRRGLDGDGEGMGQRTQHGYMFYINALARPGLMIIGFLAASALMIADRKSVV